MNKGIRKIDGSHTNIAMAMDSAKLGPQLVDFFGNAALLISLQHFLELAPADLASLQDQARAIVARGGVSVTLMERLPVPARSTEPHEAWSAATATPQNASKRP